MIVLLHGEVWILNLFTTDAILTKVPGLDIADWYDDLFKDFYRLRHFYWPPDAHASGYEKPHRHRVR